MYFLYPDIIHPISLMKTNCTIYALNILSLEVQLEKQKPNNFIVQFLKEFWFSLKRRLVIKAAFQRLQMVPQTDIRYLNEAHGESKSWHICIINH